jgi:DNA-binding CsgD family transcriptional regulator
MLTTPREIEGLKPQDRQMLLLYALGVEGPEVARLLGVTWNAMRNRGVRIRAYTGTVGLTDTVYWALENNLIPPVPLWGPLNLSTLDRAMMGLLAKGLTLQQIGRNLGYSVQAIQNRLTAAMDRNRALSRYHLVAMFYSEDCYDPRDLKVLAVLGSPGIPD